MEETSLSDFLDGESDAGGDSSGGESGAEDSPASEAVVGSAGPEVTAAYRPAGGTCECCEVSVGWLWTDGEERVCRDCKEW